MSVFLVQNRVKWLDSRGTPVDVGGEMTVEKGMKAKVSLVEHGEMIGDVGWLRFRDPNSFVAGKLHDHMTFWRELAERHPFSKQEEVLDWIGNKVSIFRYLQHFKGTFKGELYDSDCPPEKGFKNNVSCNQFIEFIQKNYR